MQKNVKSAVISKVFLLTLVLIQVHKIGAFEFKASTKAPKVKVLQEPTKIATPKIAVDSKALKVTTEKETESLQVIDGKIRAVEKLLTKKWPEKKRLDLLQFQAVNQYQMARGLRFKNERKQVTAAETEWLNKSLNSLKLLLAEKSNPEKEAYFKYLQGLVYLDLEQKTPGYKALEESLAISQKTPFAQSLSLFMADNYFDTREYKRAEKVYLRLSGQLDKKDSQSVDFKMVWLFYNTGRAPMALEKLDQILKIKDHGFYNESVGTLAFFISERMKPAQAIGFLAQQNLDGATELALLWSLYSNFLKNATAGSEVIFDRLVQLEADPIKRVRLFVSELEATEASGKFQRMQMIWDQLLKNYVEPRSGKPKVELKENWESFLYAGEKLLEVSIGQYQKEPVPTAPTKQKLEIQVGKLRSLDTPSRDNSFLRIQLEFLNSEKRFVDLLKLIDSMKSKSVNPEIQALLVELRLAALDSLFAKQPEIYRDEFMKDLSVAVKDETRKDWLVVAEKFSALMFQTGKAKEIRAVVTEIHQQRNSEDSAQKLGAVLFELKSCPELEDLSKKFKTERLLTMVRECQLSMATLAKNDPNQFDSYQRNILAFLDSTPDPSKRMLAMEDYLTQLKKRSDLAQTPKFLLARAKNLRWGSELGPFTAGAVVQALKQANFALALELISGCVPEKNCSDYKKTEVMIRFGQGQLSFRKILAMHPPNLGYYEAAEAMLNPSEYLKMWSPKEKFDKSKLLLATELMSLNWNDSKNRPLFLHLKSLVAPNDKPFVWSPSYMAYQEIKWPADFKKHNWSDNRVAKQTEIIKATRSKFLTELKQLNGSGKREVLKLAIQAETKMALLIQNSQIPKGLAEDQLAEYRTTLQTFAKEFSDQSLVFAEALKKITNDIPPAKFEISESGDWPRDLFAIKDFSEWITKNEFRKIYVWLDLVLAQGQIEKVIYCQARKKLLLTLHPKVRMQKQILADEAVLGCGSDNKKVANEK